MAHEIDMSVAGGSAAFAREPAWHGLGKVLPDVMTGAEAILAAGLQWKVEKRQLMRLNKEQIVFPEDDTFSVVRDDTDKTLGVVSSKYQPCQNEELSGFLDAVIGAGARIESAGALHGGRRIWFLCNLKESFEVVPGDQINPYALFVNGHDGRTRLRVLPTTVRVVCQNTMTIATNGDTLGCTIVHNGRLTENVKRAQESLGLVHTAVERMKLEAVALAAKRVREDDLAKFFVRQVEGMKLSKDRAEVVLHQIAVVSHDEINNLTGMRGSAWAAYNAFSEWVDHAQRRTGLDARVESIWMGEGARQKSRAWGHLLAM